MEKEIQNKSEKLPRLVNRKRCSTPAQDQFEPGLQNNASW